MSEEIVTEVVESPVVPVEVPSPSLSETQILAAATNSPALSPDEFKLGDKTYKIVYLPYDDYVEFLAHLQPFLETLVSKKAKDEKVSIPGIDLGIGADSRTLMTFCLRNLPDMVRLIVKQTDPTITLEQIKTDAGNPFVLANIVLQQVSKNGMIGAFASFFRQVAPLLKAVR